MQFAENLKKFRKAKKISQTELADYLGISQRTVSHYENETAQPSLENLCQLADILEVSIDELVGYVKKEI